MKIIIYDGNPLEVNSSAIQHGETVALIYTSAGLLRLIQTHHDEDIEGEIWPSARNNPEFKQILKIIHEHKRKLHGKTGACKLNGSLPVPIHQYFSEMLEQNNIFM
jgi:hypothetical protein